MCEGWPACQASVGVSREWHDSWGGTRQSPEYKSSGGAGSSGRNSTLKSVSLLWVNVSLRRNVVAGTSPQLLLPCILCSSDERAAGTTRLPRHESMCHLPPPVSGNNNVYLANNKFSLSPSDPVPPHSYLPWRVSSMPRYWINTLLVDTVSKVIGKIHLKSIPNS